MRYSYVSQGLGQRCSATQRNLWPAGDDDPYRVLDGKPVFDFHVRWHMSVGRRWYADIFAKSCTSALLFARIIAMGVHPPCSQAPNYSAKRLNDSVAILLAREQQ